MKISCLRLQKYVKQFILASEDLERIKHRILGHGY